MAIRSKKSGRHNFRLGSHATVLMLAGFAYLLISLVTHPSANAQNKTLTEKGIKSYGAGTAWIARCEVAGFLPVGRASDLIQAAKRGLRQPDADGVVQQYQRSLHEKKLYVISKDKWIPAEVTKKGCGDAEKVIPLLIDAVTR